MESIGAVKHLQKLLNAIKMIQHGRRTLSVSVRRFHQTSTSTGTDSEKKETHFGFQTVLEDEKQERVDHVFKNVAEKYDLMNDVMSAGIHRLWKDYFVSRLGPTPGTQVLDVAGGTGDIAFRILKYAASEDLHTGDDLDQIKVPQELQYQSGTVSMSSSGNASDSDSESSTSDDSTGPAKSKGTHVTVCDINQSMLDVGMQRAKALRLSKQLSWVQSNAEHLDIIPDNTYDVYTIAYGIRNVTHIDRVLSEAYRVLKPGGRFMCLEFSHVNNPLLRYVYDEYSFQVIPVMGKIIAGDWNSYQYLVESIRQFPKQEEFKDMIHEAGFECVSYENIFNGVTAIHSGFKL